MTFAWSMDDMKGIALILPTMNLTLIPHSNRSNKLGQERANAVNEEFQKLLKAGSNVEVS